MQSGLGAAIFVEHVACAKGDEDPIMEHFVDCRLDAQETEQSSKYPPDFSAISFFTLYDIMIAIFLSESPRTTNKDPLS